MTSAVGAAPGTALGTAAASALPADDVVARLGTGPGGLTADEVARRHETVGPNVIAVRRVRFVAVLARQLRSALLLLLVVTATVSFFLGNRTDAAIIGVILVVSVGLGCFNEYRAELAAQALHTQIRHEVVVRRDGHARNVDVTELVPGDVVRLTVGQIVPADVRILRAENLECDESVLTGESVPAEKSAEPVAPGAELGDRSSCAFMGTVVRNGDGEAVVVVTGR